MRFNLVATGRITVATTVGTVTLSFFLGIGRYNTLKRTGRGGEAAGLWARQHAVPLAQFCRTVHLASARVRKLHMLVIRHQQGTRSSRVAGSNLRSRLQATVARRSASREGGL